jgi:Protein of unknown function (DUF2950)
MTFIVSTDGKDLGPETAATAKALTRYDPDATWQKAAVDSSGTP